MLNAEELAQVEQVVERAVRKALAEDPVLCRLNSDNGLALIELRLNQFLGEAREIKRLLREAMPGKP